MADNRPRSPDRKLAWIAPLSIAGVVVAILLVAWLIPAMREAQAPPEPAPPPPPAPVAPPLPAAPPPPLAREELIREAEAVAAEYAAGTLPALTGKDPLVGRQFVIRIPFGCQGLQARSAGAQAFTEYDAKNGTVRLVARPAVWTTLPLIVDLPGADAIERVEGFWIPRPWKAGEACPPRREGLAPATPTPPASRTLGLAQLFEAGGSRLARRGDRPYEFVRKVPEGDITLLAHSYRLVLEGRLVGFPGGRALRCWSESADHRPVCLYSVSFDRVAFEDAVTGDLLAEWRE